MLHATLRSPYSRATKQMTNQRLSVRQSHQRTSDSTVFLVVDGVTRPEYCTSLEAELGTGRRKRHSEDALE